MALLCAFEMAFDMKRLLVVGAGGHGRSVAEAVLASSSFELAAFVDDAATGHGRVWGFEVLGPTTELESYRAVADAAVIAIGNNKVREMLHARVRAAGFELATIIHPRAFVSSHAVLGPGCTIMAGAIVGTEGQLGEGVIVNCGAVVDHHCKVEDFGHLGVNACMAGGSVLGRRAWMQAGSALAYSVRIDMDEVVAAGWGVGQNA